MKKNAAILLGALLLGACSNNENLPTEPSITPEPVVPVDFRFITLNFEGNSGTKPTISFVKNNGSTFHNMFFLNNDEYIGDNPESALQHKDNLLISTCSYWTKNVLEILNPNTLEREGAIQFNNDFFPYDLVEYRGDSIFAIGEKHSGNYSAAIIDIKKQKVVRTIDLPHSATRAVVVKNKLITGKAYRDAQLMVGDIDNITHEGMRVIGANIQLFCKWAELLVDKNENVWVATSFQNGLKLICIDPTKETVIHEVMMPNTVSTLDQNTFGMTLCNEKKTLYVRAKKAFYAIDIDNPKSPDEPTWEYIAQTGALKDLKITKEGSLLFIDENLAANEKSEVIEVMPRAAGKSWQKVKVFPVGHNPNYIYIAEYAK